MGESMRKVNQLSPLTIAQLTEPGKYHDGLGLYLHISPTGNKSWAFRYMIDRKAREQGLGPLHTVNLAEARNRARESRQLILDGRDPLNVKRNVLAARRLEQAKTITFRQAVSEFLKSSKVQHLTNDKHRKQWTSTLHSVFPFLGDLPLNQIDPALMLQALKPMWERTPETASRLRGRIERVFDWAKPIGYFQGDNPAQWDLLRDHLPAKEKVKHLKAMPYADLPAFMADLRKRDTMSARALEFTILTAVRTQESIGAKWSEIDQATWTIPAVRMKMKRDHRVPLTERAIEILSELPRLGDRVFPRAAGAMLVLLQGMVGNGYTVHGFRSSFSDWARDKTDYPRDVIEMALAHTVRDKSEAAYRRGDALEKRRDLMAQWGQYVGGLGSGTK
jgi:integrase